MSINKTNFFNNALVALRLRSPEEEKSYSGKLYSQLNNLVNKANLTNNRFLNITLKTVVIFALIAPAIAAVVVTSFADGIVTTKNGAINLKNKITKKPTSRFEKVVNFVKTHKLALAVGFGLIGGAALGYRLFGQADKLETCSAFRFGVGNYKTCPTFHFDSLKLCFNKMIGTEPFKPMFGPQNKPMFGPQDKPMFGPQDNPITRASLGVWDSLRASFANPVSVAPVVPSVWDSLKASFANPASNS